MTDELKRIVEEAYSVFKKYSVNKYLDVCTDCCITENQEAKLIKLPVNRIKFGLLYDYNTAAKTEKPSLNEFKHFIPRFLELTSNNEFLHHDIEIVFSRFDYYKKDDFTKEENGLFQKFSEAYFRQCLSAYPFVEFQEITEVIIMLGKMKIDLIRVLNVWGEESTSARALHLSDLINKGFNNSKPSKLNSPFSNNIINKTVNNWLEAGADIKGLKPIIEDIILYPKDIDETRLNYLNWLYEKINLLN